MMSMLKILLSFFVSAMASDERDVGSDNILPFVSDGKKVDLPFLARLNFVTWMHSATVLNEYLLVTSANIINYLPANFTVHQNGEAFRVKRIGFPKMFNPVNGTGKDLAFLQVDGPMKGPFCRICELSKEGNFSRTAYLAGHEYNKREQKYIAVETKVKQMNCKEKNIPVDPDGFCFSGLDGRQVATGEDNGGPVYIRKSSLPYCIIGVNVPTNWRAKRLDHYWAEILKWFEKGDPPI